MKPFPTAVGRPATWLDEEDTSAGSIDGFRQGDSVFVKTDMPVGSAQSTPAASHSSAAIVSNTAGPAASESAASTSAATSSGKYFSPYVDMTLWTTDIAAIAKASKLHEFTLAFMQTTVDAAGNAILKNGLPSLSWGGLGTATHQPASTTIKEVKALEAQGDTITISMGGAAGLDAAVYAAAHHLSAARLQAEYQAVINAYGVTHLDFDIENIATVNNFAANHLRDLAIVGLQAANPGLTVSFTLATTPKGLGTLPNGQATNAANDAAALAAGNSNDLGVLKQAIRDGVRLDTVNIMAMDYYDGNVKEGAPNGTGVNAMYTNAVSAANATERQLTQLGIASTTMVGITPMIGQNDDVNEVFTLADARKLEAFAASTAWVAGLGEWQLPRDMASTTLNLGAANASYSGVIQTAYQFAHIFDDILTAVPTAGAMTTVSTTADSLAPQLSQALLAHTG